MRGVQSIPGVCEVEVVSTPGASPCAVPDLLIEVPHGATRRHHFEATRRLLVGEFADDLAEFFLVNTDVGSIEVAREVSRLLTRPAATAGRGENVDEGPVGPDRFSCVWIVRGVVARTFIDCNRVIEGGPSSDLQGGLTPGLPAYIGSAEDVQTLRRMHAAYQGVAEAAYRAVCGAGGRALILHTYAPRSVQIERVDEGIVAALRQAYEPRTWENWELRPEVDLISRTEAGELLAPEELVRALRDSYDRAGVAVTENTTYRLHRETMGHVRSAAYPGQVICLEIRRDLLADPFLPFVEVRIGEQKVQRMAAPIATALEATTPHRQRQDP